MKWAVRRFRHDRRTFQNLLTFPSLHVRSAELEAFYTILTESFEDVDVENVGLISVEVSPAPSFLFRA
jgi:hypothetical protein